jgi:gelsolin
MCAAPKNLRGSLSTVVSSSGDAHIVFFTHVRMHAVGSDLDHKIKAAAAEGEPQWDGLGETTGLKVWRIEQFRVVPWPSDQYGSFHTGDSYLILNSYQKEGSDAILHDLHMWIGASSSQDEYGTAAYKMVEADEALGGAAIQHRETQGYESSLFASYFSNLNYLDGGVESGFTHVEPSVPEPHLYRIKGTEKGMSLQQVPLSKNSLSQGDSYVLFASNRAVWVWHGASANPDEKAKANALGETMCTAGTVTVLDSGSDDDDEAFWNYLGEGEIAPDDNGDEAVEPFHPTLFQVGASDLVQVAAVESVAKPSLSRSLLDASQVYLLDAGWELFLWMGASADRVTKMAALSRVDAYCAAHDRTADLPRTTVKPGFEPSSFASYFVE